MPLPAILAGRNVLPFLRGIPFAARVPGNQARIADIAKSHRIALGGGRMFFRSEADRDENELP